MRWINDGTSGVHDLGLSVAYNEIRKQNFYLRSGNVFYITGRAPSTARRALSSAADQHADFIGGPI
jgi:hypothetical protein